MLKERRPASIWATGMCSFTAAKAPASVELVSPKTKRTSGDSSTRRSSMASSIRPVCFPWEPEPMPR